MMILSLPLFHRCLSVPAAVLLLLLLAVAAPTGATTTTTPTNGEAATTKPPPNILLLLTDDQDAIVGGMAHMPKLEKLLQQEGVTFANGFVHTPICCPSRSSIMSGRYLHNGGALNNSASGNCNGEWWQADAEQNSFATLLKAVGYKTSFAGKYLNQYGREGSPGCSATKNGKRSEGCRRVPPGWDRWYGLIGNSRYYHYHVIKSLNGSSPGVEEEHGSNYERDYFPDLVAQFTLDSIEEFAASNQPFMATIAWPTAHMPFTQAPWSRGEYDGLKVMKTPNFNASAESLATKHWMMRWLAPIDEKTEKWMNEVYENRTEALMSVDNHIEQLVHLLKQKGVYDNTWIIYTSDNGWQLGQHRLSYDKRQLYENDIRVPFIVTGPGVPKNTTSQNIVLNVDIAPTMADIASQALGDSKRLLNAADQMDGQSFVKAALNAADDTFRKDFLVSYHGEGTAQCGNFWNCPAPAYGSKDYHMGDWTNNTYHCVRTISEAENTMYCRMMDDENFVEYYDITTDEWQMHNAIDSLSVDQRVQYERRLDELRICKGKTCREKKHTTTTTTNVELEMEVKV